jgi:hypothetical protein
MQKEAVRGWTEWTACYPYQQAHVLVRVPCGAPWMGFAFRLKIPDWASSNSDVGQHITVQYPGNISLLRGFGTPLTDQDNRAQTITCRIETANLEGFDIPERSPIIRKRGSAPDRTKQ